MPRLLMLLVITATEREARAVLSGAPPADRCNIGPFTAWCAGPLVTIVSGIGPAAAAATTAAALALGPYNAAISMGIAGGFPATGVATGDVVVADPIVCADLGVDSEEGWMSFTEPWPAFLAAELAAALAVRHGPVVTVNTMTSTDDRADELAARHPGVLAEAMEGAGVAVAAARFGVPVHEIRAVSNAAGRRDRSRWDVDGALAALAGIVPALVATLEPM